MDLIRMDHTGADTLLDRVLAPTIFSVRTSRRLFRGMVGITETQSWQRAFRVLSDKSRWDISDDMVERQMGLAYQLVMEVLGKRENSLAKRLDPAGDASLGLAKRMRVDVMRSRLPRDPTRLSTIAARHFGLPSWAPTLWNASVHDRLYTLPDETRVFVGHDYQPNGREVDMAMRKCKDRTVARMP